MGAVHAVTTRSDAPADSSPGDVSPDLVGGQPDMRLDELADIISAYNRVTENLQRSHESLRQQVARLQRELASTDAQLQRSRRLAALGEMAAGIAHEIRNPLAAIRLYTQMLEDDLTDATQRQDGSLTFPIGDAADTARRIGDVVRGLNAIVTDVLDFARELKPKPAPLDIEVVFRRALRAQQPTLDAASIHSRIDVDKGLHVVADGELIHQALLNLIRNAADAMGRQRSPSGSGGTSGGNSGGTSGGTSGGNSGGASGGDLLGRVVTLAAREDDGVVVVTVRDTGPGIAEDEIDRIFNPFFTTRNTGTGLGLAIVHRIVDAHGGAIAVHNDEGAVFELSLPCHATVQADEETPSPADAWPAECVA